MKKLIIFLFILLPFLIVAQPKIGKYDRLYAPYIFGGLKDTSKLVYIPTRGTPSATTNIAHDWKYGTGSTSTGMVMTQAGFVGIGTTSVTSATLNVGRIGSNYNLLLSGVTDGVTAFTIAGGSTALLWTSRPGYFEIETNSSGKGLNFKTTGGNAFLNSAGNFGVNTLNPSAKLHISGKKATALAISTDNDLSLGDSTALYIDAAAKVGIGTTAPTAKLHVASGTIKVTGTGADSATLSPTKGLWMYGAATQWDDLVMSFETGANAGTGYPVFVADSGYYNFVIDTTGASKCIMYFVVQMPHSWKEGSMIYPHVHYKHETGIGTPKFILKYKWYALGGTTDVAWNWYKMESTTGTTNKTNQISYNASTGISGSGKALSSLIICQLYLSATPDNVKAYTFDIHYERDKLGSNNETTN